MTASDSTAPLAFDGKRCTKCGSFQPRSEFTVHKKTRDGLRCWCRACEREYHQRRYGMDPSPHRRVHLKHRYGITPEEYAARLESQNGCAICHRQPDGRHLHVDHDHDSGLVRGILCGQCNSAIGMLGESVEVLESAIAYLESAACLGEGKAVSA